MNIELNEKIETNSSINIFEFRFDIFYSILKNSVK